MFSNSRYAIDSMLTFEKVVELILGNYDAPLAVKMARAAVEAFNSRQ
jgi:hypothetical protein